jgi:hypothetical protein
MKEPLVADVKPCDDAVKVYEALGPVKVQALPLTTPETAGKLAHCDGRLPPLEEVNATVAVEDVTTLPPESSMVTPGPLAKLVPDTTGVLGCVVKRSWVATPGTVGEKLVLVAGVATPINDAWSV